VGLFCQPPVVALNIFPTYGCPLITGADVVHRRHGNLCTSRPGNDAA
jgi:hypothetical protein